MRTFTVEMLDARTLEVEADFITRDEADYGALRFWTKPERWYSSRRCVAIISARQVLYVVSHQDAVDLAHAMGVQL